MFWILFPATLLGIAVVDGLRTRRRAAPPASRPDASPFGRKEGSLRAAEPPR